MFTSYYISVFGFSSYRSSSTRHMVQSHLGVKKMKEEKIIMTQHPIKIFLNGYNPGINFPSPRNKIRNLILFKNNKK